MPLHARPSILIATLGSEPQVVTAAADLLSEAGERLTEVWVLHTQAADGPVASAPAVLQADFAARPGAPPLRLCPIYAEDEPISDLETPQAAEAALRALYGLVREAKLKDWRVHLSIAGGRKNLAVYAMVTAQLLFDERDCLYHLYSAGDFLTSKRLHPQPGDEARLLLIPVLLRDYISPALTHLRHVEDPLEAIERIQRLNLERRVRRIARFVEDSLTPAEARAAALLVREGVGDQEIAARLNLSARTVEQQLRAAYAKAADFWELEDVNRAQLIALLYPYFSLPGDESAQITGNSA